MPECGNHHPLMLEPPASVPPPPHPSPACCHGCSEESCPEFMAKCGMQFLPPCEWHQSFCRQRSQAMGTLLHFSKSILVCPCRSQACYFVPGTPAIPTTTVMGSPAVRPSVILVRTLPILGFCDSRTASRVTQLTATIPFPTLPL